MKIVFCVIHSDKNKITTSIITKDEALSLEINHYRLRIYKIEYVDNKLKVFFKIDFNPAFDMVATINSKQFDLRNNCTLSSLLKLDSLCCLKINHHEYLDNDDGDYYD